MKVTHPKTESENYFFFKQAEKDLKLRIKLKNEGK